ncbi:hypothetical protein MAR_002753 [Mya arenaria]|uniref:Uncharacterized protein n=1 Tax=Mya arenaria TaxID=6604 RepID=A0ABY7G422_MYAAR|nr:hypothetical protein MAR_002753 [Mya arenaria]
MQLSDFPLTQWCVKRVYLQSVTSQSVLGGLARQCLEQSADRMGAAAVETRGSLTTSSWTVLATNVHLVSQSSSVLMTHANTLVITALPPSADIYTGETGPCRVFDGDGSHKQDREDRQRAMENQKILEQQQLQKSSQLAPNLADIMKPMLAGNIPEKKSVHHEQKLTHVDHVGKPVYEELKKDVVKSGPINAAPVLKNAGPPIQDPDLLSLLQAFPHEMRVIPSEAIQGALKTHPNDIDIAALQAQAVSEFSGVKKAAFETPIEQSVHKIAAKEPMHKELVKLPAHVDSTGGKIVKAQETPLDVLYPELKGMVPHEAPLNTRPKDIII